MAFTYKIHDQWLREDQYELFYDLFEDDALIVGNQIVAIGQYPLDDIEILVIMETNVIPKFLQQRSDQETSGD